MQNELIFDYSGASKLLKGHELEYLQPYLETAHDKLHHPASNDEQYLGWLELPNNYDQAEYLRLKKTSNRIRKNAEVLIVIGIGGSYLGARSALELLQHSYYNQLPAAKRNGPQVYFVGNNLSSTYLSRTIEIIKDKDFAINVISKSGTTLESAIAFRIFMQLLQERYNKTEVQERIIITTDKSKGALKSLANQNGYETFIVPDDIGGRYSVLTPVGLLPLAIAGIDTDQILAGAKQAYELYKKPELDKNQCYQYAALRQILLKKGKIIELLVNYEPEFVFFAEWWKQLFGESEGKDHKGIFPAGVSFTTDLHSMGQYIQDGPRNMFATTLWLEQPAFNLSVPYSNQDYDQLNYLANNSIHSINKHACQGTMAAHIEGGIPNLKLTIPQASPLCYGKLVYFFEKACAISGYLLGVNPFDQPGVEAYKKKLYSLLGGFK